MNIENNKLVMSDIESRRAFLFTLEWLLALLKRYKNSLQFGLVHIEFGTNPVSYTHLCPFTVSQQKLHPLSAA